MLSFVALLFGGGLVFSGATHAANYSIRFGGSDGDFPTAVTADQYGVYIAGYTYSTNFPGAPLRVGANQTDADLFVTKLDLNGEIEWSVVIGGSGSDFPAAIAPGTDGDIYVAGRTSSTNFPTTNALQSVASANGNAFVFKLNAAGQVRYSTYLGGNGYDG